MSDTSQGHGWWLAADGKWYPPELHPDVTAQPRGADRSQGPGWWLASDGRWYPPEQHPRPGALEHPASAPTSRGPGWWMASDGRWYPPELHPDVMSRTTVVTADPETSEPEVPVVGEPVVEEPVVEEPVPAIEDTGPTTDPVPIVPPGPAVEEGDEDEEETPFSYWQRVRSGDPDAESPGALAEARVSKERRLRRRRRRGEPLEALAGEAAVDESTVAEAPAVDDSAIVEDSAVVEEPIAETAESHETEAPVAIEAAAQAEVPPFAPAVETRRDRRRRQGRRRAPVIAAAVVVLAGAVAAGVLLTRSSGTTSAPPHRSPTSVPTAPTVAGWTATGVHVVGGPVVAAGHLLVLDTATDGTMALAAVDPRTGKVQWQQPYSPSAIPAGVLVAPVASGGVALDLAPSAGATNSAVTIKGIDVATGQPAWTAAAPATVVDAPVLCTTKSVFCVNVTSAAGTSQLEQLDPAKGTVLATVSGPHTQMASGLYQTQAQPPGLVQVSDTGAVLWTKTFSSVFGGAQFSPQYGYDFVNAGALEVGTVGVASVNGVEPLGSLKTVGLNASSGAVAWSVPGALDCFGVIPVSPHFLCRYSGSGTYVNGNLSTNGVVLTLEGLDPATGAAPWSMPLSQAQGFTTGNGVPVADTGHVVVPLAAGPALLDLMSGQTTPVPANATFWCGQSQQATVQGPSAALSNGQRVGVALFAPCTAQGAPSTATPASALPGIGVSVDGLFVWPSTTGLVASPVPR